MMDKSYDLKRQSRYLNRLKTFIDVFYAIMLWQVFVLLPDLADHPEAGDLWALFSEDPNSLVMIGVGVFFIITYWGQNNRLFSHLVRTDIKHMAISILQLVFLLIYLYGVDLGTHFEDDFVSMLLQSASLALAGFMSVWGWAYATNNGALVDDEMPNENGHFMKMTILPEPVTASIAFICAFFGPLAWDAAWLTLPVVGKLLKRFIPSITQE